MKPWHSSVLAAACMVVTLLFLVAEVKARRGGGGRIGGGRSFSRSGPAASGSIRSHHVRPQQNINRQQAPRDNRGEYRENRPADRGERRENWGNVREGRSENRPEGRDDWREHRENVREERREYMDDVREDRRDWYDDRHRYRVGTVVTYTTFSGLSCTTTEVYVDGVTYYRCGYDWYTRAYRGGSVTYIVVAAPPGY